MLLERCPVRLLSEVLMTSPAHQFAALQERLISLLPRVCARERKFVQRREELGSHGKVFSTCPLFGCGVAKVGRDDMDVQMVHGRSDMKPCANVCFPISVGRSGLFIELLELFRCDLLGDLDFRLDYGSEGRVRVRG